MKSIYSNRSKKFALRAQQGLALASLALFSLRADAYSTRTHIVMSHSAFNKSELSKPALQAQLGITNMLAVSSDSPFRSATGKTHAYAAIDAEKMTTYIKNNDTIEQKDFFLLPNMPNDHSLVTWLMRGAIREDDNSIETPDSDEEGGVFARVYNHFLDPYNNSGLNVGGVAIGRKSSDWALKKGAVTNALKPNLYGSNSAVEAMYRALTLRRANGYQETPADFPEFPGATEEEIRKMYWATVFRDLGNTIHLLQDAAQPQHTRNDKHSGIGCVGPAGSTWCAGGHDSFYEKYINARTIGATTFILAEGVKTASDLEPQKITLKPIDYGNYGTVVASSLEAYFATGENSAGSGLANYSNRGFYTFGRNVFEGAYPLPRDFSLTSEVLATPLNMAGSPLPGKLTFMKGSVPDSVRPELTVNARLSTVGAWNQFLTKQESFGFSLNYYNYDDQAALLIPRAVGYSAGFINHFFRGKLEITLPKDNVYAIGDTADPAVSDVSMGFSKLKLNIRNISSGLGGVPALQASGSLRAVVKFHRNKCYLPDFSGEYGSPGKSTALCRDPNEEIVVSSAISAPVEMNASPQEVTFIFPRHIPIGASDFYLQVVYRGPLGEDSDAIAMGTKDISEPTFHTVVDIAEQFVYGEKNETFRTYICDHASPPITFEDCKSKYGHSVYLRFSAPENFDPNDPVPTFGAIASWAGVNVSQYGRIVYLTDLGPRKLYALSTGQNTAPPLNYAVSERNVAPYQFDKSGSADQPPLEWQQQRGAFFADFISSGPINPAPDFVPGTPHVATLNFMDTVASKTTFTAPAITSTSASSMGQSRTGTLTSNMSAVGVTGDQQDDSTVAYDGMLSSKPVRRP